MKILITLLIITFVLSRNSNAAISSNEDGKYYGEQCKIDDSGFELTSNPDGLDADSRLALFNYTQGWYTAINSSLWRNETVSKCDQIGLELLDRALEKLVDFQGIVFRGSTTKFTEYKIGEKYLLKGYTSTSLDREVAESFLQDRFLTIETKRGKDISAYSVAAVGGLDEKEILLPRNTLIRVTKIEVKTIKYFSEGNWTPRKVQFVWAEEI